MTSRRIALAGSRAWPVATAAALLRLVAGSSCRARAVGDRPVAGTAMASAAVADPTEATTTLDAEV